MPSGMQRLVRQTVDRNTAPPPPAEFDQAKVTAVSGASPPVVTVSFRGGSYQFPHNPSYTPTVGDVVALARYAGSWVIAFKPVGFPS